MKKNLVLQELNIAVATNNQNPSILTFDFLKYSGIVPEDWELGRQPVVGNQGSQIVFNNGFGIVAQPQVLNFVEVLATKEIQDIQAPAIAHNYIRALPNVQYQAVGINIKGYVTGTELGENKTVQSYMSDLLAPAPWREVGNAPVKASVQLSFSLERGQFNLGINEGNLYVTEQETVPIILFTGNFSYVASGDSKEEQLQSLHQQLDNWQTDLKTYQEIIETKFLVNQSLINDAPKEVYPELLVPQR